MQFIFHIVRVLQKGEAGKGEERPLFTRKMRTLRRKTKGRGGRNWGSFLHPPYLKNNGELGRTSTYSCTVLYTNNKNMKLRRRLTQKLNWEQNE